MQYQDEATRAALAEQEKIDQFSGDRFESAEQDVTRDRATGRIIAGGEGSDAHLDVRFTVESLWSKRDTVRNGVPSYIDVEYVTIIPPGQRDLVVHTQVTDFYQWRFPKDYAAFKEGRGALESGTPLSVWSLISPSQLKDLEANGIRTIEQCANLSDSIQMRGLQSLKSKAKEFLAMRNDTAAAGKLQAELDARDEAHKGEMAAMREQMAQMMKLLEAQKPAPVEPTEKPAKKV